LQAAAIASARRHITCSSARRAETAGPTPLFVVVVGVELVVLKSESVSSCVREGKRTKRSKKKLKTKTHP